jgi:CSLREA domain-containing protein
MKGIARLFSVFLLLSLLLTGQGVRPAYAASYVVNTTDDNTTDDAFCSLREAILAANNTPANANCGAGSSADDTITFSVSGTITLTAGTLPNIVSGAGTLTIDGGGNITISGGGSVRVMYVNSGANLTLQNLTIANGSAGLSNGGGIYNNAGTLTVTNATFSGNSATFYGGGIYNYSGTLAVTDSTFSGNNANYGGGIYNAGTLTVTNATFSGNSANNSGGGIYNNNGSTLSVTNSTFSRNSAYYGGGIRNDGTTTLRNTIIANSTGGDCVMIIGGSSSVTGNNNLIQNTGTNACNFTPGVNNNIIGSAPNLGALTGSPAYFPLNPGSLAIDAGDNATCAATDQRGVARPQGAACDIGSYELDNTAPSLVSFTRFNPPTSPTNADTLVFRATFSEGVQNVDAADFAINAAPATTATITSVVQVTPSQYNITVSGGNLASYNGIVGLDLATGQNIQDLVGNNLPTTEPSTDETYTVDNTAPSLVSFTRQTPPTSPTNADALVFRAAFSEGVQNVDVSDFAVNSTSTAAVTAVTPVSASVYDITVSGGDLANYNGTVGLNLAAGQNIQDLAGNALPAGEPATDETYTVDNTAPSLSFTRFNPPTSPTNADTLVFRATFDEGVQNVDVSDFAVNSTSTAAVTAVTPVSASEYDITVSGGDLANYNGTVGLNLAGGQNIQDLAGNVLPAGEPATDETYTVENTAPSLVSFTRQTPSASPTNADTLVFRAAFSEGVQNVDVSDFAVNSTSTAAVTAVTPVSASVYDITVSGGNLASYNGTVGLNLAGGQNIQDLAGNALPAGEPATDESYTVDNTVPAVQSITRAGLDPVLPGSTVVFTVTFSETVTGVDSSDFSLTLTGSLSGTNVTAVVGAGTTYTVSVNTGTGSGILRLDLSDNDSIVDIATNPLGGSGAGNGSFTAGESYTVSNPPVANAGADQTVATDAAVTLDGTGSSDPDGDTPLSYGWTQTGGPVVALSDAAAATPGFTAPSNPAVLTFRLVVTDSLGLASAPDEVVITVGAEIPVQHQVHLPLVVR